MRPMRRQDREVTDPEKINAVIDACTRCRLGFCDQGRAYVVPVNFGHAVENGRHVFYFHSAPEGRKIDLIRASGRACVELDTDYRLLRAETACGHTAAFRSVIGEGPIVILEDLEAKRRALSLLMAHTAGSDDWTFPEAALKAVCVYQLTAEELSCKEHL